MSASSSSVLFAISSREFKPCFFRALIVLVGKGSSSIAIASVGLPGLDLGALISSSVSSSSASASHPEMLSRYSLSMPVDLNTASVGVILPSVSTVRLILSRLMTFPNRVGSTVYCALITGEYNASRIMTPILEVCLSSIGE